MSSKVAANVMVHVLNGENKIIEHTTLLLPTKSSREGRGEGGGMKNLLFFFRRIVRAFRDILKIFLERFLSIPVYPFYI